VLCHSFGKLDGASNEKTPREPKLCMNGQKLLNLRQFCEKRPTLAIPAEERAGVPNDSECLKS